MKNIYKITKGQLITIWIFGIIGFFIALEQAEYSGFATFLVILIPALLIFYTIGWNVSNENKTPFSDKKIEQIEKKESKFFKVLTSKKVLRSLMFLAVLSILIPLSVSLVINKKEKDLKNGLHIQIKYDSVACKINHPLLVVIDNQTNKTLKKVDYSISVHKIGYSSDISSIMSSITRTSDKIIKPKEEHAFCTGYKLDDLYLDLANTPEELEFHIESRFPEFY